MAGLYDRIEGGGLDGQGFGRVNTHLAAKSLAAYVGNVYTRQQVIDVLNSQLALAGSPELRTEDIQDIDAIADVADAKSTSTQKLIYGFTVIDPVFIGAELNEVPEANWRNVLEIGNPGEGPIGSSR